MALVSRTVPVKLGRLDTKVDPRWALAGDLVSSENLQFDSWPKLRKRNGFAQAAAATSGEQLVTYKANQLLLGTGLEALSYSPAAAGLVDRGVLEALTVSARPVRRDAYVETIPDSAVHPSGITVYTWETSAGGSQYSVFDSASGQPIVNATSLGVNAAKPKPIAIGNYVVILYYDTGPNHLKYIAIPVTTPGSPTAPADFATNPNTNQVFDATAIAGQVYVAYANNAVANKISLKLLTSTLVLGAEFTPTSITEEFQTCCAVFGDSSGQRVWLAYFNTIGDVAVAVFDAILANVLLSFAIAAEAPGTVRNITGVVPTGTTTATVIFETTGSQPYFTNLQMAQVTLAGSSVNGYLIRSVGLASKAFVQGGRIHVLSAFQSPMQSTYFLLSVVLPASQPSLPTSTVVVGKLAQSVGGGLTAKSILPEVSGVVAGVYSVAYLQTTEIGVQAGRIFSQSGVMGGTLDFTAPQTAQELSDDLHLCGGILSMYDGQQVCEHGFHLYPEGMVATPSSMGGSIGAGTYQYVLTYEWMDAQGLVHQSSPSAAIQVVTSGATSSVAFSIPTLRLTSKTTPISVVVWRTQANQSVLYRLTSIASPLLNNAAVDTVSYTDTAADSAIGGNAQIYSNPLNPLAEVANIAAPAPLHVWRYRNRVALIPAENSYQWVYSKASVSGVPVEFNAGLLFQSVSQDGGPLTCGIEMDEKNILFTATRIYYVSGDGPAPNATNSDYGQSPLNVPTDVGCVNRRSLVLTPQGIMFQSAKGIYLLDRGLQVSYVGSPVEAFNGLTITSAKLAPNSRRVLFFTNGGVCLAYDYLANVWSTWLNVAAADAVPLGTVMAYVRAAGQLLIETPGAFADAGSPILIGFTTSILSFAGLSGFQRVWRIGIRGDYRSPHSLIVSVAYDDSPAPAQRELVDSAAALMPGAIADTVLADVENPGDGPYPPLEYVVKALRQKCSSIQVSVQESQSGTPGEGLSISGMAFVVGALSRLHPVPKARSI